LTHAGTGKTVVAAFDYRNFRKKHQGEACRLLFVAHREEILTQSWDTLQGDLREGVQECRGIICFNKEGSHRRFSCRNTKAVGRTGIFDFGRWKLRSRNSASDKEFSGGK